MFNVLNIYQSRASMGRSGLYLNLDLLKCQFQWGLGVADDQQLDLQISQIFAHELSSILEKEFLLSDL